MQWSSDRSSQVPTQETTVSGVPDLSVYTETVTCRSFHKDCLFSHAAHSTLFINTPTQEVLFIGLSDRDQRRTKRWLCQTSIYGKMVFSKRKQNLLLQSRLHRRLNQVQDKHQRQGRVKAWTGAHCIYTETSSTCWMARKSFLVTFPYWTLVNRILTHFKGDYCSAFEKLMCCLLYVKIIWRWNKPTSLALILQFAIIWTNTTFLIYSVSTYIPETSTISTILATVLYVW